MSAFGKEKIFEDFTTPNVSKVSQAPKCELTPKVTSVSVDEVYNLNMFQSDNVSEAQEEVKPCTITATFTPKKMKGLKLGSKISRGLYGRRRYGTSRGNIALQNVKNVRPFCNLPKQQKSTLEIDWQIPDSKNLRTPRHSIPKKSSDKIPVKTSADIEEVETTPNPPLTHPAPKNLPSNPRHGLIDRKKLAATTDKARANLKTATFDEANSTLEFEQLENQQNTSHEMLDSSQIDDSKDSSYSPSKETQESSSTEQTSIDQSGELEHKEDEDNMNADDDCNNDEEGFVLESDEEDEPGKVRAKDYITINVPSGTLMSPKSRQKCIYEYSKVIGKKGVRFSFAGNYPDIYYNPPEVQSNMKGFSASHTGIIMPNRATNTTPIIPKQKESVKTEQTPMNISNNEETAEMSMLERPQLSSTPKSNNSQSRNTNEEKPQETPNSFGSKGKQSNEHEQYSSEKENSTLVSDRSMKEPNSKEQIVDDGQEADGRVQDGSIDKDSGASFYQQSKYFNSQSRF